MIEPPHALYPDPQILYDPDPEITVNMITANGPILGGVFTGAGAYATYNWARGRPLRASLPVYIPWILGFTGTFVYLSKLFKQYYSRRDTIHKHYIKLHPELFPPPPKILIGDILEDWGPTR
ncbi:uncharacterized protein ND-B14.5B [Planococcus citri]|uniref:uncharacterized protein ND-B14.5B n=1 Tax=Planococcus citri TaxID=170843 RepID=UPI0031F9C812